jgi:hypothetical protein
MQRHGKVLPLMTADSDPIPRTILLSALSSAWLLNLERANRCDGIGADAMERRSRSDFFGAQFPIDKRSQLWL